MSLAKKYQYKYAFNIMNSKNNINIELNEKYKIISNDIEFLQRVFGFPSDNLLSYSQIEYKGPLLKAQRIKLGIF